MKILCGDLKTRGTFLNIEQELSCWLHFSRMLASLEPGWVSFTRTTMQTTLVLRIRIAGAIRRHYYGYFPCLNALRALS